MRARALVTLTLGSRHRDLWLAHARASWEDYARRHGFDLIAIDTPLDESPRAQARSPAWQKLLILGHPPVREYEQVVWLDSDIVIHPQAPSVFERVPLDRVGAVEEFSNPTPQIYLDALRRCYAASDISYGTYARCETRHEFYRVFGFQDGPDAVVHSGVMVFSPVHHRELLEHVYDAYEEKPNLLMEMRPLSYELVRSGRVHWLDPRFNLIWAFYMAARFPFLFNYPEHPAAGECVRQAFAESYFLHFAGLGGEIGLLDTTAPLPVVRDSWLKVRRTPAEIAVPVCETPVALFLYNRADKVTAALAAIRRARPRRLLLMADAANLEREGDEERCGAARAAVEAIDWDCEVRRNFAEEHLGIRARIDSGLAWVFSQVEEAILLEDDCVAHPTFFRFCEELLERYREEPHVMSVCGTDFRFGLGEIPYSYTFSRYPLIWGWATWRRAWRLYDPAMSEWPAAREREWVEEILGGRSYSSEFWTMELEKNYESRENWDTAWLFSAWRRGGLAIHPRANLVTNVGFGDGATHTHDERAILGNLPADEMEFPLVHPPRVERNAEADEWIESNAFGGMVRRLWARIRKTQRLRRSLHAGR